MLREFSDRQPDPPRDNRVLIGGLGVLAVLGLAVVGWSWWVG